MNYYKLFAGLVLLSMGYASCTLEEDFLTTDGLALTFSQDTVRFDTVFTQVGSATQLVKIYNPFDQPVNIQSVKVSNSAGGRFIINVDGTSGDEVNDVFLPPSDSVYVFVEVTVDPDQDVSVSPFIFEGELLIQATTLEQRIVLEAFGQNANYIPGNRGRANFGILTCDMGEVVFDDPRPYVLYGSLVVDECTLTLPAGTRLYVHGGLVRNDTLFPDNPVFNDGLIIFQNSGRLNIEGTEEEPVLIATDRLEERFLTAGGQYSGIRFGAGTGPHFIRNARIRNGIVGFFADSVATLTIEQTEIAYTASAGVIGYQANVNLSNVSMHNNGTFALQAVKGGNYNVDYTTIASYGGQDAAALLTTGFEIQRGVFLLAPLRARIRNSIFFGSAGDEFAVSDFGEPGLLDYQIENSILRSDRILDQRPEFEASCMSCFFPPSDDSLFVDVRADSFQLDTLSIAEGLALPIPGIEVDLLGNPRDATFPDIGAYEYVDQ